MPSIRVRHLKEQLRAIFYNTSGSWNVGKKFRMLAKFIELGGKQGPKYVAAGS
jgi:hypothetical protein